MLRRILCDNAPWLCSHNILNTPPRQDELNCLSCSTCNPPNIPILTAPRRRSPLLQLILSFPSPVFPYPSHPPFPSLPSPFTHHLLSHPKAPRDLLCLALKPYVGAQCTIDGVDGSRTVVNINQTVDAGAGQWNL